MLAELQALDPAAACLHLARSQHHLIHRDQAVELGLSRSAISRLVAKRRWLRVLPQTYSTDGPLGSRSARAQAASLWGGRDAVLSHTTAAWVWGLEVSEEVIDITAERRLRSPTEWVRTHCMPLLLPMDVRMMDGVAVSDPTRTLVDLASMLDERRLEQCTETAIGNGLTSRARLRWRLKQKDVTKRSGTAQLRLLIERQQLVTTESPLELRFEHILRDAKLPPPVRQYPVIENGRLVARLDFAYPEAKIAIEIDGYAYHSGRKSWFHDRERRNKIVLLGWRPVHFTSESIDHDPELVVERVKKLRGDSLF